MTSGPADPRALRAGRAAATLAAAALLALFALAIAAGAARGTGRLDVLVGRGWTTGELRAVLADWGVPVGWFVGYVLLLELAVVAVSVVAAVVIARRPLSWFRLYVAVVLVLHATVGGLAPEIAAALHPGLAPVAGGLRGLAWFMLFPLAYVFPDGRFVPRRTRWLLPTWAVLYLALTVGPAQDPPPALAAAFLVLLATGVAAQVYRYARVSGPVQRRQTGWVLAAIGLRFLYLLAVVATPLGAALDERTPQALGTGLVTTLLSYLISALLPVIIAVAVVRHHLFDLDIVVSRTLVYGMLTVFVVGAYALAVGGAGTLWPDTGGLLPVVLTALVAVAVSPLRGWLQRRVDRLVYGQRDDPYSVVSELGIRLGSAMRSDTVLSTIVDTIGNAMRLPYVTITLAGDAGAATFPASAPAPAPDRLTSFPLGYRAERLGVLTVATAPGERLDAADRGLLGEVSRQAGVAVRAASLTADLQRARERAVAAREEERRRLHRDLHDGLGPTLASLYQRVDTAARLIPDDPDSSRRLLGDVRDQIKTPIGDIRELVYALRPPALDELGLVGAVEEGCRRLNGHPDRLAIEVLPAAPLPALPAVVEVAAYRIAIEAVTNLRHADARTCTVSLAVDADRLVVRVVDDGAGLPAATMAGVGIRTMRERAEEIGGRFEIGPGQPGGTVVTARLPLAAGSYPGAAG